MDEVTETEILDAGRSGRVLDCAGGGVRRAVDAGLLRRSCLELKDQIDPRGIGLHQAMVIGCLDLAGLEVPFPLRFEGCEFDSALVAEGAQLHELALTGCTRLPGLLGNGLRIRHDLDLSRSMVTGAHRTSASTSRRSAIWLCESDIGGRLRCLDTAIHPDGDRALQADRMRVGGMVGLLSQFTALGEVRLLGVRIGGSLDLTGARIESPTELALNLGDAVIGGSLFIVRDTTGRCPVIRGCIYMRSARIAGRITIRDATLAEADNQPVNADHSASRTAGIAVRATRLSLGDGVVLEGTTEVSGEMDLSMSEMSGLSIGSDCLLHAARRTALDLTNAELRSTLTRSKDVTVEGTVRLAGARIHGKLSLQGARLREPERGSLVDATGLCVDGDLQLQNFQAVGGRLRFGSATLGGVIADGARLANPGGFTLGLHQATIKGSVILARGFESVGLVMLSRSTIEGRLDCTGGYFTCPAPFEWNEQGHAIEAVSANIRGGMDLDWAAVSPSVDFTNAGTTFLADTPANWPSRFLISGFTYDRFEQPRGATAGRTWDYAARCAWLDKQAVYDAGPYEQAARVFRQHGYTSEAETILIAQRTQARRMISGRGSFARRALDTLYGVTVAYGYRPGRVLWLLAALLVFVICSLEIPVGQATLRATTSAGIVYTTRGPLRVASTATHLHGPNASPAQADACGNGQVHCFSPVLYAIDTVVPLVSLDQRSTWYPDPYTRYGLFMQWWLNAALLLGWLLSSIFVLSLARIARSS